MLLVIRAWLVSVCLSVLWLAPASAAKRVSVPEATPQLVVNQAGYLPTFPKQAMLINSTSDDAVELVRVSDEAVVTTVTKDALHSVNNGWLMQKLDFSDYAASGTYFLRQGELQSPPFPIGEHVFNQPTHLMLRSYYLQRCGVALDDPISGLQHAMCHDNDGFYARDDDFNKGDTQHYSAGGWHDAGDYGKYIAPAAVAVSRLLSLYLMDAARYPDDALHIPESGNDVSDLLDEVKVELDWMLTMQRTDGGVYRKLSGSKWPPGVAPEDDTQKRWIYGVSNAETGKFIATMAIAARAYQDAFSFEANKYKEAAEKSWRWLAVQADNDVDWQKSDDSGSGKYMYSLTDYDASLLTDEDDRVAAAIELYLATREEEYLDYILAFVGKIEYTFYGWKDVSALSFWHLLENAEDEPRLEGLRQEIRQAILQRADRLMSDAVDGCMFGLANQRFVWGSNKRSAEEGITLLHAWRYTGDARYRDAALKQIDYLFGHNPHGISFVSAVGEHSTTPMHIFGNAIKAKIPGLLVGGPNVLAQDGIAPLAKGMLSYTNHPKAYSVNEYAIDYNSALIGLLEIFAMYRGEVAPEPVKAIRVNTDEGEWQCVEEANSEGEKAHCQRQSQRARRVESVPTSLIR